MAESRPHERVYFGASQTRGGALQTVIGIKCPFCDIITEAYVWSLAGSGKRCECGAVHHYHPAVTTKG